MSPRQKAISLLVLALAAFAGSWWWLREALTDRLVAAATRDLDTIVELVALDLGRSSSLGPPRQSFGSLGELGRPDSDLARTLARIDDENLRRIYFFDASGRIIGPDAAPPSATDAGIPAIVRQAVAGSQTLADSQGALFEPYLSSEATPVVGVWHWLAALRIGVVAERPYERFIQPVRWIDAIFFGLLVATLLGLIVLTRVDPRTLRSAFRRADIDRCGAYTIKRLIGEGSVANVYLAEHRELKRVVALKRLRIHSQRDEVVARFNREVRLASQLSHPNIITVLDHGRDADGNLFYTMEFIRGMTLTQWVEQHGPLPPARALRILRQICAAVGTLHARQLLHRDIKPDNVIAYAAHGDYDLIKLLDFGLIRDLENTASRDLTRNARIVGTPAFMAPERLLDPRRIDPRTDLYGIGCIAFYLLVGRRPFEAKQDGDLVQQVQHVPAPAVSSLSVFPIPLALDAIIASALAKRPEDRPASAEAFDAALREIEAAAPWHAEQARLWWQSVFP